MTATTTGNAGYTLRAGRFRLLTSRLGDHKIGKLPDRIVTSRLGTMCANADLASALSRLPGDGADLLVIYVNSSLAAAQDYSQGIDLTGSFLHCSIGLIRHGKKPPPARPTRHSNHSVWGNRKRIVRVVVLSPENHSASFLVG